MFSRRILLAALAAALSGLFPAASHANDWQRDINRRFEREMELLRHEERRQRESLQRWFDSEMQRINFAQQQAQRGARGSLSGRIAEAYENRRRAVRNEREARQRQIEQSFRSRQRELQYARDDARNAYERQRDLARQWERDYRSYDDRYRPDYGSYGYESYGYGPRTLPPPAVYGPDAYPRYRGQDEFPWRELLRGLLDRALR